MKAIDVDELKKIQIDILDAVHRFCIQNNIKYSLAYGTLLGAVRHRGYIPWDDDIDIMMPRTDYERFLTSFNQDNDIYRVRYNVHDDPYNYPYAKVEDTRTRIDEFRNCTFELGINIDVFPIDTVPDDLSERKRLFKKSERLQDLRNIKQIKIASNRGVAKNAILILGKLILLPVSIKSLSSKAQQLIDRSDSYSSEVGDVVANTIKHCFPREVVCDYKDIEFEGKRYCSVVDTDTYLTKTYGNYMQLPPEEKRVSTHLFAAFWKD